MSEAINRLGDAKNFVSLGYTHSALMAIDDAIKILKAAQAQVGDGVNQQLPEGHTAVKTETLQWLLGEAGGFECPKDEYFNGIQPKFWWRRHLRAAIATAQEGK
jgi:hypothetical protein